VSESGVVKFECEHVVREVAPFAGFAELNSCRRKLLQLRMVGVDAGGIGFGNLSVRDGESTSFYITASGTGALAHLQLAQVAKVTGYDFERNWVRCEGAVTASSESLTHAAVYESAADARAVIHCHSPKLWQQVLDLVPTTRREVEYGTPEMAFEMRRLLRESDSQVFAMGGHPEGLVAFGKSFDEAFHALMNCAIAQH
jgi:ribulose-5-phosphate 4-epimerase/fuculose-1-phosphate aldolase